ncbi:hypothetical protein MRO89_08810 [Dickeya dianthicola]|nr:hypothetical protein [Dickeya dianthicola]MCI4186066.1 hypothetical protein [Dickeya dianthicola]MCI4239491.1 hypothetical protein [Dickeya dianthicola]MCI4256424.1 hypothetical protein [Dickeya dianthicola]
MTVHALSLLVAGKPVWRRRRHMPTDTATRVPVSPRLVRQIVSFVIGSLP